MDPSIFDPNNPVPEVSPYDTWGDACQSSAGERGLATVLPPKRLRAESVVGDGGGKDSGGLRIESNIQRRQPEDEDHQLEIQQIDGSVVRLNPEMPVVERVPRQVKFHELPQDAGVKPVSHGEGKEWGRTRRHSVKWIVGTGLGVAGVVVGAMMMLPHVNQANAARPQAEAGLVVDQAEIIHGTEALNDMLERQPEAEQVYRKFVTAPIIDEVIDVVRDAEEVEPLMRNSPRLVIRKDWLPPESTVWNVYEEGDLIFGILEGPLPDFSNFCAYFSLADGELHLDWKASRGYGSARFSELANGEGDTSEIRAWISPSGFYTSVFPESDYQSYQLISPDGQTSVWCYVRRGANPEYELARLFQGGEILKSALEKTKVTVRLARGPEGALPNQWMVGELLCKEWITP